MMNNKTAHLLWFLYRFPKRFFQLGIRLNQCFRAVEPVAGQGILKTEPELQALGYLTATEIKAWRQWSANTGASTHASSSAIYAEVVEWLADPLNRLINLDESAYPPLLRQLKDPPLLLFCRGNWRLLHCPQLAVVGSRVPSCYGQRVVREWVTQLVQLQLSQLSAMELPLVITSGFAHGIDHLAHRAALAAAGYTVAVLGSGLVDIYPSAHRQLFTPVQLQQQALMVSEFPLRFPVRAWLFPYRNRIISGLSLATLIVEAKLRSGSLITARLAAEQGREVMAVPGAVHNPLSAGCHHLLQQGATLVSTVEEVAAIMQNLQAYQDSISDSVLGDWCIPPYKRPPVNNNLANSNQTNNNKNNNKNGNEDNNKSTRALESQAQKLLDCIEFGVVNSVEEMLQRTQLSLLEVKNLLILLQDDGYIEELIDGYTRLK